MLKLPMARCFVMPVVTLDVVDRRVVLAQLPAVTFWRSFSPCWRSGDAARKAEGRGVGSAGRLASLWVSGDVCWADDVHRLHGGAGLLMTRGQCTGHDGCRAAADGAGSRIW